MEQHNHLHSSVTPWVVFRPTVTTISFYTNATASGPTITTVSCSTFTTVAHPTNTGIDPAENIRNRYWRRKSRKKFRVELSPEDGGHSSSLKDAQLVVKKYATFANVADMGKLACMLARQSFFGDDVLKISTMHGKSAQYQALDRQKLSALLATIHELPEFCEKSKQEFSLLYMPKINSSLSRLCTNLQKM